MRLLAFALLAAFLVMATTSGDAFAKNKKHAQYWGSAALSGTWNEVANCQDNSFVSNWQFNGLYDKTPLGPAEELDQTIAGAAGGIDWTKDEYPCDGSIDGMGRCSVGASDIPLPVYFDKATGGLKVDFQLSLAIAGCDSQVYGFLDPYPGAEPADGVSAPSGFIPKKKIGKKKIEIPISGNASGSLHPGESFSGNMSGALTLTRKKPLQTLPED